MNKKNYLIVGHTGFIGQKLLKKLNKSLDKNNIYLISKKINSNKKRMNKEFAYDVFSNLGWFKFLKNNMTIFFLAFNNNLYELEKDQKYYSKIMNFSFHFNEYLIRKNLKVNVIFTSTATIYGITNSNQKVNEKFPDKPISVYDKSKLIFERVFKHYSYGNNLNFVSLRISNIYGYFSYQRQKNRGFLNKIIIRSINGEVINIVGKGSTYRSYLYIDDLINALIIASKKVDQLNSKTFLLCGKKSHTFNEIIKVISNIIKKKIKINKINYPKLMHKIEKRSFKGSYNNFKKITGWMPKIDIDYGIDKIIKEIEKEIKK